MIVRCITIGKRNFVTWKLRQELEKKDFHFKTNKTSLYHLHDVIEITSDERKTLTKISMRNLSQQFPQTSAHFARDKIRNPAFSCLQLVS